MVPERGRLPFFILSFKTEALLPNRLSPQLTFLFYCEVRQLNFHSCGYLTPNCLKTTRWVLGTHPDVTPLGLSNGSFSFRCYYSFCNFHSSDRSAPDFDTANSPRIHHSRTKEKLILNLTRAFFSNPLSRYGVPLSKKNASHPKTTSLKRTHEYIYGSYILSWKLIVIKFTRNTKVKARRKKNCPATIITSEMKKLELIWHITSGRT